MGKIKKWMEFMLKVIHAKIVTENESNYIYLKTKYS